MEQTKTCAACGITKSINEFQLRVSPDKYQARCKQCLKDKVPTTRTAKRKELAALGMNECTICGEVKPFDEFVSESRNRNGVSCNCKACVARQSAEDREKNKDLRNKTRREYHQANYDEYIEKKRAWGRANKESVNRTAKRWRENNKEKKAAMDRARRARKRGAEGSHTAEDIAKLREAQENKCVYCGANLDDGVHVDHIMPLVLGGTHYIENIQLLCPFCNLSKGGKHPDDYEAEIGFVRHKELNSES